MSLYSNIAETPQDAAAFLESLPPMRLAEDRGEVMDFFEQETDSEAHETTGA